MVTGAHPNDIDLFDYVEGDLPAARTAEIRTHLARCAVCAEQVQRVQMGKEALRGAQFLHLPERRVEGVFMNLPTQPREPRRRRALGPKQLIAVLTPVVAVVAVIGVLVSSGTDSGQRGRSAAAGGGAADTGAAQESAGARATATGPAFSIAGEPADVAKALRDKGLRATVEGDAVVVRGATKREVREALADRAPGDVRVYIDSS